MVSSECAPVAQAGGLGEVVFGLSRELEWRGHAVEIILPKYDCMRYDRIWDLRPVWHDLVVPWNGGAISCTVWHGFVDGRRCLFIEPHAGEGFFSRRHLYGSADDVSRFGFFSKAALELLLRTGRRPDVIHCHDWQTALVPVLLYEIYSHAGMWDQRVCFTIHNFCHQGIAGERVLWETGLGRPDHYLHDDRLRDGFDHTALNLMKGGIVYSNFVTTVSPRHAWEARYTDQGRGLGHTLHVHGQKFGGVLNGIDYSVWNPEIDPFLAERYSADWVEGKYENKRALRERFWLRHGHTPVVAYVGRIDGQKGMDLIEHAIVQTLGAGGQFVLLGGACDAAAESRFRGLKHRFNDHPDCHLEIGYRAELAHLVFAGADLVVVPSVFEPCGLAQMIALKYGTVPVVRATGGLVDTVFDRDHSDRPHLERNGFVFHQSDAHALHSALSRALGLWYTYPQDFRFLMLNGMRSDHSWGRPGQDYVNIYEYISHR